MAHSLTHATLGAAVALLALAGSTQASTMYYNSGAQYRQFSDSPFNATSSTLDYFYLETFEDGLLNTLGVTGTGGQVRTPSNGTDSVDKDDGVLDGIGRAGHDYWGTSAEGNVLRFTFDAEVLGGLPTYAGLVWTDGLASATVRFEAFDAGGVSLGYIQTMLGDAIYNGTTPEDRFMGIASATGIAFIQLSNSNGGLEMDHLQYGGMVAGTVIPLPPAVGLGLAGLGIVALRRRRAAAAA
jgi:hypothetical protein